MAKYPVTNRLLSIFPFGQRFLNYGGESNPAIGNTWYEAFYFALWIGCRLPTEAEWEFAARGGKYAQRTQYFFGNSVEELSNYAWFGENSRLYPHAVNEINSRTGKENLNPLGLANILGNVLEWCQDWYGRFFVVENKETIENPLGPEVGKYKVLRGGNFRNLPEALRCAHRGYSLDPGDRTYDFFGFRLVRAS